MPNYDEDESRNNTIITVISDVQETDTIQDSCLVVIYGDDLGKKYNLDELRTVMIGRSSKCDVRIDQESVSRNHCRITFDGSSGTISDLGSTNGTFVNDRSVKEYQLQDGDLIKVGRCILKFISGDNIEHSYHEEIYRLTTIDGLTEVYNRRYFMEALEREISRSKRYKRDLSLIMYDIDHFKRINDTFGHLAGDRILRDMSQLVSGHIRSEDIMARYGGEEFAIILPETGKNSAAVFAEKIRKLIDEKNFIVDEQVVDVTVSIGVACYIESFQFTAELIAAADRKLYEAKDGGRNCVRS